MKAFIPADAPEDRGASMRTQELVQQALAGHQEAFAQLVERFSPLVRWLTTCYVGSRDGPDAAQEIWLAVHRKLWQLSDGERFLPWLRRLTFYQCINFRKRRGRWRELYLPPKDWLTLADFVADGGSAVESLLERWELRHAVGRALDRLPADYGLLLRLKYLKGLSLAEIGRLTNLPVTTLKWRLHQGRKLLRAQLASGMNGKGRLNDE